MSRIPLKSGEKIELGNEEYVIDAVLGDGASCIVYAAYYEDNIGICHKVNIKEVYPYKSRVYREGQTLIWESEEEREQSLCLFRDSYEKLMAAQNDSTFSNSTAHVFELYEKNQTIYSVMNVTVGQTFDKEDTGLLDSLKTILALTKAVKKYHNKGFLHLDIKPNNFLVIPETRELVILFDFDSVVSIEDIKNGRVSRLSYSRNWAAPEQMQGRISKLCPATDIYAIGAILFEKIMGRPVQNDDIGIFAKWKFDNHMFDSVNPKIKRLIDTIFKRTLAANIKRRYQSTEELIEILEETINAFTVPFLMSNIPQMIGSFVGRDSELDNIHRLFNSGCQMVCLTGMGGIGKSRLAEKYAQINEKDYEAVLYSHYSGSLKDLLEDIEIYNFEGSTEEHKRTLHNLLNKDVLLVIDGLDDEGDFNEILNLRCKILITSRLNWSEYGIETIEITAMHQEQQIELFEKEYGRNIAVAEQDLLINILRKIDGYTLLIPLLAKQMAKGLYTFNECLGIIEYSGIKDVSEGKIRCLKDNALMSGTVYSILLEVLNIASFTEEELYVMRCLTLLNQYRIDRKDFVLWIGNEYNVHIDELCFNGWIHCINDDESVKLDIHSVVADLCREELKPSISNCEGIAIRILDFSEQFALTHKIPRMTGVFGYAELAVERKWKYQYDKFTQLVLDILYNNKCEAPEDILFWINVINNISNVIYGDSERFNSFLLPIYSGCLDDDELMFPEIPMIFELQALQKDDLKEALIHAKIAIKSLKGEKNIYKKIFDVCFAFYQYVCLRDFEDEWYWETPGFDEMADFVKKLWEFILEHNEEEAEFVGFRYWNTTEGISGKEMITIVHEDFLKKTAKENIELHDKCLDEDICDILTKWEAFVSMVNERMNSSDERDLIEKVSNLECKINAILENTPESVSGIWMVLEPPKWDENEKNKVRESLANIDVCNTYIKPFKKERNELLFCLAKMEAAFTYAYAMVEEWEKYEYHMDNLMKYYEILIGGRRYGTFRISGISDIDAHLPGASSLLNKYGAVLPNDKALQFISRIITIMEEYHSSENIGNEYLFEVYEMALNIAEKAKDKEEVDYYKKIIKSISSVYFERKNEECH